MATSDVFISLRVVPGGQACMQREDNSQRGVHALFFGDASLICSFDLQDDARKV